MQIREWMTTVPITVTPTTPVSEARQLMQRKRIRHLLVVERERLVGIITDRDIRLNLPSPATSLSVWEVNYLLTKLTVEQVMTRSVITISPDRPMVAAVGLMLRDRIGALPVTEDGWVVGIITETDMLHALAQMLREQLIRTVHRAFYCPSVDQNVAVRFLTRDGRRPIGVMSCSAFADPEEITCAMSCLTGGDREKPRVGLAG